MKKLFLVFSFYLLVFPCAFAQQEDPEAARERGEQAAKALRGKE